MSSLLLVDDDVRLRERLARAFRERGLVVFEATDHKSALAAMREHACDWVVLDLRMPGPSGLVVLRDIRATAPAAKVVVVTGYSSIATAVEAMRLGAYDYLTKPAHADQILDAFAEHVEPTGDPAAEPEFEIPSMARLEYEHIERVLREMGGNISKAAKALGMARRTLQYKLAKYPVTR